MKTVIYEHIEGGIAMQFEFAVPPEPVREKSTNPDSRKDPTPPRYPHSRIGLVYNLMGSCIGCLHNHEHPCGGIDAKTTELISRENPDGTVQLYLTAYAIVHQINGQPVDTNIVNLCPASQLE